MNPENNLTPTSKICRQPRRNGKYTLFVNVRITPKGTKPQYKRISFGYEGEQETTARVEAWLKNQDGQQGDDAPMVETVSSAPSIALLCREFMDFARQDYPPTSQEPNHFFYVLKPFVERYGAQTIQSFSLAQLEQYRADMIASGRLCRKEINARIRRILRVFKFGARRRLVPIELNQELHLIESIRRGRLGTRDNPRVRSAPLQDVIATLPYVSSPVAAMIKLQLYTGARPGEIRMMRAEDLDTSGNIWHYTLATDKTARFRDPDDKRVISLHAEAQAVIKPFLRPSGYLFRPADAMAERRARDAAARKTRVQPSQIARHENAVLYPKEMLNDYYTQDAYRRCIKRACERAGVPAWHPYQLRHTAATAIQRAYGIETARSVLGHVAISTTEIYLDKRTEDADKLAEIQPFRGVF